MHVHAMLGYKQHLYIGEYEGYGGTVFRTDGSAGSWETISCMPNGTIRALCEHNGFLYTGLFTFGTSQFGSQLLYYSKDGKNWGPVPGGPTGSTNSRGVCAIASAGAQLFAGTKQANGGAMIYEISQSLSICQLSSIYENMRKNLLWWLEIRNNVDWEERIALIEKAKNENHQL